MFSRARDGPQQKRVWTTVSTVLRLRNPGGVYVCVCVCVCVYESQDALPLATRMET